MTPRTMLWVLASAAVCAAGPADTTVSDSSYYPCVLQRVQAGRLRASDVDFGRFMYSYFVRGEKFLQPSLYEKLRTALKEDRCADAVTFADSILRHDFTDIRVHYSKASCHKALGDSAGFNAHMFFVSGMLHAITDGRDGRSAKSAFHVYQVANEYAVLDYLGLSPQKQSLLDQAGRSYDRVACTDQSGKKVDVYFDITEHVQKLRSVLAK
jgi:hypothetical protein